uniref:Ribosome biogenesis protein NOP53 n=1 Tax=Moina brachiata TaxID=675436 RepID=A0A4Y7NIT3_9CRUS|nr:EOG090X07H9 [Moina brachiata]SVE93052.1 EOG090X07H9 [Moina brachiata]
MISDDGKTEVKKPRRLVKHKKKTWRVTDIGDVDRFLESQRSDERRIGPLNDLPDENFFVIPSKQENVVLNQQAIKKKRSKEIGPLKCHAILTPSSAVPDPLIKRNRVRTTEERADPLILKIKQQRRAEGKIPRKYVQSIKDRQKSKEEYAQKTKKPERLRTTFDFDLWGDKGDALVIGDKSVVEADLADEVRKYTLDKMGKRIYSRPQAMFKKTTALPAVEVPHPGASYNPTFQDHQELLQKACQNESKEIHKEKKISNAIAPMLKKVSPSEKQKAWMSEMSQGLDEDDEQQDESAISASLVRPTKPKTLKQKKKAKMLKFKETHRLKLKETKKRMMALDQLRSIRRQIRKSEEEAGKRAEKRKKEKEGKLMKPAVLGRYKYEPAPLEVNLSDEIAGTLRGLKTEGNLLIDRYKSLQRRNIVEPRIRHRVVYKYKHKVFIKRSHATAQGMKVGNKSINSLLNK